MRKIYVVLVEPKTAGNIGAVARVMSNFNFKNLVLVEPRCNYMSEESLARAKKGKNILKKARVFDMNFFDKFDYVIGTTAKIGSSYNIIRSPLTPEDLREKLKSVDGKIAIVFGREEDGLRNEEIKKCDFIISIGTSVRNRAMNLSHSVAVVLYEIFKKSKARKINKGIKGISKKEKEIILNVIDSLINKLGFSTENKKETQRKLWKRLIGKAMLTKREAYGVIGFFKKIKKFVEKK